MSLPGDLLCRASDTEQPVIFSALFMALPLLFSTSASDKERGKKGQDGQRKLLLHEGQRNYQALNRRKAVKQPGFGHLVGVIKISIKRQGQRLLGRRFHSIFCGWRQTVAEAQQREEERKGGREKSASIPDFCYEGLGEEEQALRKSKALLNSARNNKLPKRSSDSSSGDAASAADRHCWSASSVTLIFSGDSPM